MSIKKEKLTIILVDDMPDEHLIFNKVLQSIDFVQIDLISFDSGAKLENFLASDAKIFPHIIFLDMNMPELNGMHCLNNIRLNPSYMETVVAMYSVISDEQIVSQCLGAGANIFITKPRELETLKSTLEEVLKSCIQYHSMALNFETFVRTF